MDRPIHPKKRTIGDFTGGMIDQMSCVHCGSTGNIEIDRRLYDLAMSIPGVAKPELLAEMFTTAARIARGRVGVGDFKLSNRALKEMFEANETFHPYDAFRKVAIFGSARTSPDCPDYQTAQEFAHKMAIHDFMTITGAGPGIMAAGNEGAGRQKSFGLNITLPFEASANEFIANDEKLIHFNYFFTRKLAFVKEADAIAAFPGGFGTMDEAYESLTLIQTGKTLIYPILLVDCPGGEFWKDWEKFIHKQLLNRKLISPSDLSLFKVTDNVDEAVEEILHFYKIFHSYRYIGDKMVIRLEHRLSDASLDQLNSNFADIVKSGRMEQCQAFPEEKSEQALEKLPRLVFRHERRDYGRLRELINAINVAETLLDEDQPITL